MTAAGVGFVLGVVFFFGSLWLIGPLTRFLTPTMYDDERQGPVGICIDVPAPPAWEFSSVGAAIGLGVLIWLRFARRGPYLPFMIVLLNITIFSGLLVAACYRGYVAASVESASHVTFVLGQVPDPGHVGPMVATATSRIPLITAGAALLVSAMMSVIGGWTPKVSKRKHEPISDPRGEERSA